MTFVVSVLSGCVLVLIGPRFYSGSHGTMAMKEGAVTGVEAVSKSKRPIKSVRASGSRMTATSSDNQHRALYGGRHATAEAQKASAVF